MALTKHLRLADIKDEDAPERLIEIIQNHSGKIPKEEREEAIVVLIRRFQYLIKRNVFNLFNSYKLESYCWDIEDLMQEAFLEFCYLVCHDFKIKADLDDTGLAVFGNYIKVKLYRRLQYGIQEKLKKQGYNKFLPASDIFEVVETNDDLAKGSKSTYLHEIHAAMLGNSLSYDDLVLDHITNEECERILRELIEIGRSILEKRDYEVWYLYHFSGESVVEIGAKIQNKIEEGSIGRSRVLQIAKSANGRIVQEFGRRSAMRRAAI